MENILSVNLSSETSPIVEEVRGKDWIEYGTRDGGFPNLYPNFLIDLYNNSSTHRAIITTTAAMIAGNDIIIDEDGKEENVDRYVKLQNFFNYANGKETLHEVLEKVALDFKLQGAFALHLIWNKAKTEIVEIHHVPCERVRAGIPNAMGVVDTYYVSADWSDTRENPPTPIAAFNSNDRTGASQLLYSGLYSPNMDVYHTPDYLATNNWALVDQKVAEFHLNNISNGFSGSYMINFANGVPTQEERISLERSLANKFSGSSNSGKMVITFSDDKTRTPEIFPISVSNADKQYLALQELLVQNILTGHRVVSPLLFGIKSDSGLGSNVDELNAAFEVFLNTVIKNFQVHILRVLAKIFKINDMDMPISFVQAKPITTQFDIEDMRSVMTQEEIREELGLAPLEQDEVVEEDDFDKVGMIDGKPVYNTKEEAMTNAERLGCSGYHEHEYEGKTVYMACESHEELMNFSKTELDKFIYEFGEDEPDGYKLLNEEIVDEEHEEFDFENELNNIHHFATVPKDDRDGKSEDDGWSNKVSKFFKVRYKYDRDSSLTNKSGTKREFCRKMMGANKLYKKEDLIALDDKPVNKGFGINGAATYSIWKYKGGPQCFHRFIRKIYVMELEDAYLEKDITKYGDLISTAKARSQGFYPKPNDKKVAQAPRTMKDRGYYN
tara:strand:- start:1580 stop:3586 length:2007 start_codon:yes stop_codon:yes gene_type:complete